MILTVATTRVRHLINQTDNTNTLYDDTNFIANVLNEGRRLFASILPESKLPKLRKSASLTVASNVGAYPSDFLRPLNDPYVLIDSKVGRRVKEGERWRLRYLSSNDLLDDEYYYERSDGVVALSATSITYEYLKTPDDLSGTDNVELPSFVDDLVVDYAFKRCMGTTRGDKELALMIWRDIKEEMGALQ